MAAPMKASFVIRKLCNNLLKNTQYRQAGSLVNRLLGDVKWKGKDPSEKLDPPQDTDVTVQELVDTTITEVVPVRKRQSIETVRGYKPPLDVEERLQALTEQVYNDELNEHGDWRTQPLHHRFKKYKLLTKAMKEFDHDIPNFDLHLMSTVDEVVKFFQTEVRDSTKLEDLSKLDLPKNLHMNLEPIRFDPETDTVHGGKTAFPGNHTIVSSIKYKRKYKGYEGKVRWK